MGSNIKSEQLIVPVYINEKIVLDMLAIMEDGFSMVSQVSYSEHKEGSSTQRVEAGVSTSATILSKLLKINMSGELAHTGTSDQSENVSREKVHTNVSLLSKFRRFLVEENVKAVLTSSVPSTLPAIRAPILPPWMYAATDSPDTFSNLLMLMFSPIVAILFVNSD